MIYLQHFMCYVWLMLMLCDMNSRFFKEQNNYSDRCFFYQIYNWLKKLTKSEIVNVLYKLRAQNDV